MEPTTPGRSPGTSEPVEFVVDLAHLGRVQNALDKLGVKHKENDRDKGLDLALLELTNLANDVRPLRDNADLVTSAVLARVVSGLPATAIDDLDLVMFAVRKAFADRYEGWTPTMGKNRLIGTVEGVPHTGGGVPPAGLGDPKPVKLDDVGTTRANLLADPSGRPVRVGILDTRLVPHNLLDSRLQPTRAGLRPVPSPSPSILGHGTFVAGLIAQRAPNAKLEVRSVLSDKNATAKVWAVARKMAEFADVALDVEVLNMSFVCATADGQPPLVLTRAVELLSPRILLVAAAGNHGGAKPNPAKAGANQQPTPKTTMWPAAFHNVVAVGADALPHDPAPFSPELPWVRLMAPGVDVESTYLDGKVELFHDPDAPPVEFKGYATWSGTSFAAATVSGEFARRMGNGESAEEALAALRSATHGDIRPYIHNDEMK